MHFTHRMPSQFLIKFLTIDIRAKNDKYCFPNQSQFDAKAILHRENFIPPSMVSKSKLKKYSSNKNVL